MAPAVTDSCCCPRCGYDLSGSVATWTECCPLDGTCNECGLEFRWQHLQDPRHRVPRWSFEHARGVGAVRFMLTVARSLVPSRFWKAFPLEAPIRVLRLLAYQVILLVAVLLAGLACDLGTLWAYRRAALSQFLMVIGLVIDELRRLAFEYEYTRIVGPGMVAGVVWTLCFPLSLLLLGETFRLQRVRRGQIFRMFAYSVGPVLAVLALTHAFEFFRSARWRAWLPLGVPAAPICLLWLAWYWRCALVHYLRLRGAGQILLLNGLLTFLAGLVAIRFCSFFLGMNWALEWLFERW